MKGDIKKFFFYFFFATTKPIWTYFLVLFTSMSNTKALANSSLKIYTPQRFSLPLLELQRSYYFFCQLLLSAWTEVKSPFKPDVGGEGRKILQAAKLLFYCVHHEIASRSTAKSFTVYGVNSGGRWCCTSFVSPAILFKPFNLEDFSRIASLKRIGRLTFFYFYDFSLERTAVEILDHSGFSWNSLRTVCILHGADLRPPPPPAPPRGCGWWRRESSGGGRGCWF